MPALNQVNFESLIKASFTFNYKGSRSCEQHEAGGDNSSVSPLGPITRVTRGECSRWGLVKMAVETSRFQFHLIRIYNSELFFLHMCTREIVERAHNERPEEHDQIQNWWDSKQLPVGGQDWFLFGGFQLTTNLDPDRTSPPFSRVETLRYSSWRRLESDNFDTAKVKWGLTCKMSDKVPNAALKAVYITDNCPEDKVNSQRA
jgi:hypothetical protein